MYWTVFTFIIFSLFSLCTADPQCYDAIKDFPAAIRNFSTCGDIKNATETFKSIDVNEDGFWSFEEYKTGCFDNFRDIMFCLYDSNKDGSFDINEFINGQRKMKVDSGSILFIDVNEDGTVNETELRIILGVMKVNASNLSTYFKGKPINLDYDQCVDFMNSIANSTFPCNENQECPEPDPSYWKTFAGMDITRNGSITKSMFGDSDFVEDTSRKNFDRFDTNNDEKISQDEFMKSTYMELDAFGFKKVFNTYDSNKDGFWSKEEMDKYVERENPDNPFLLPAWDKFYSQLEGPITPNEAFAFYINLPNLSFTFSFEVNMQFNTETGENSGNATSSLSFHQDE